MKKYHSVTKVHFENGMIHLVVDSHPISRKLSELSRKLANATKGELLDFEISPSGYGIHWSSLDEDISIDGLLGITHAPRNRRRAAG